VHPTVLEHYLKLLRTYPPGKDVLELGAIPSTARAFSAVLPAHRYIGLNRAGGRSGQGWKILKGDANAMPFVTGSFDAIICNAMLEHDKYFWATLGEVRRVLRPGGLFFVGTPGYEDRVTPLVRTGLRANRRMRGGRLQRLTTQSALQGLLATRTLPYHDAPDYYRFSPDAFRVVILDGFELLRLDKVSRPIRIVAVGRRKPHPP